MQTAELPKIKLLDSLRAFAILLILFFHSPIPQFQFGWVGVNLFFILSGFLITRILLNNKSAPFKCYLKTFYIRRTLRIFPVYFLYLFIVGLCLLLADPNLPEGLAEARRDFQNNWLFLFTYTYNFQEIFNYLANNDYNNSFFFGHLWSLSVEEQFYLLFPFVIYFTPIPLLKRILVSVIILVPLLRLAFVLILQNHVQDLFWIGDVLYISTLFQLDTLSLGACLAVFDFTWFTKIAGKVSIALVLVLCIVGITHLLLAHYYGVKLDGSTLGFDPSVYHLTTFSPSAIFNNRYFYSIPLINFTFASLLLWAIQTKSPPRLLVNNVIMRVGKISYGIYLFHLPLSFLSTHFFEVLGRKVDEHGLSYQLIVMLVYLILLILLSEVSFRFYEAKFLKLKERYSY